MTEITGLSWTTLLPLSSSLERDPMRNLPFIAREQGIVRLRLMLPSGQRAWCAKLTTQTAGQRGLNSIGIPLSDP